MVQRHAHILLILTLAACGGSSGDGDGGTSDSRSFPDGRDGGVIPPSLTCTYPDVLEDDVRRAIDTGNALETESADALIAAELALFEHYQSSIDADLAALYGLDADGSPRDGEGVGELSWDPTHDTALLGTTIGSNAVAILSNDDRDGSPDPEAHGLAVFGRHDATPYMVMASNPFRTNVDPDDMSVVDEGMDRWLANMMTWLTGDESSRSVVLAQLDDSFYFRDESSTRAWLDAHADLGVSYNDVDACDGSALDGCLDSADLLIISQHYDEDTDDVAEILTAVSATLDAGTPVLYLQRDGDLNALGEALFALLDVRYVGDNYWSRLRATDFDGRSLFGSPPPEVALIGETLSRLSSGSYGFTLPEVAADPDAHDGYRTQFADGAEVVQSMLNAVDDSGADLFGSCGHEATKLLALIGDRLRQEVDFPMSTAGTEPGVFLRSYFADHAILNRRYVAPSQPERGTFDAMDLSAIAGESVTVELTSRSNFRAAGVYLLPGRTATITRLDDSAETSAIFVNTQRSGSASVWDDERHAGYSRPKFLRSVAVPVEPGESITFTNPYGGPLQVAFGGSGESVRLRFDGVGRHPYWDGVEDDASFAEALAAGTYAWAEVVTDNFEVHSSLEKMRETMSDERWDNGSDLAMDIERYSWNLIHVMAGFQGAGIDVEPEVHEWATERGLDVPLLDLVKHGNMDQGTCGYGCSGNPYDASWAMDPLSHGHLHELGHSLQNNRFQLEYGAERYGNHAVTNWSPFYVLDRHFQDRGVGGDWTIPHDHIFDALQAAFAGGDRSGALSTTMRDYFEAKIADGEIRDCYALFMQAMAAARHAGALDNGYHIVPRAHILDGAVDQAVRNEEDWLAAREALGFGLFSHAEAEAMGPNDFMAVTLALATGLDYRDFLAMWGIEISARASEQIAALDYPVVERAFFALGENDHTRGALSTNAADFTRIVIDGTSEWPLTR